MNKNVTLFLVCQINKCFYISFLVRHYHTILNFDDDSVPVCLLYLYYICGLSGELIRPDFFRRFTIKIQHFRALYYALHVPTLRKIKFYNALGNALCILHTFPNLYSVSFD